MYKRQHNKKSPPSVKELFGDFRGDFSVDLITEQSIRRPLNLDIGDNGLELSYCLLSSPLLYAHTYAKVTFYLELVRI